MAETWDDKVREYRAAGFSYDQISAEAARKRQEYAAAGFSQQQIDDYFGSVATPEQYDPVDKAVKEKIAPQFGPISETAKPAENLAQAFEAGFDMSSLGIAQSRPDRVLAEHADFIQRLAYGLGQTIGDLPAGIAGAVGGGALLSESGPGALAGAGAGGFALPEAIRSTYLQYYEKGKVTSPRDFMQRVAKTTVDTAKSAIIGAATALTGGGAAAGAKAIGGGAATKTAAQLSGELAGLVGATSAVEGRLPDKKTLMDSAAILVLAHSTIAAGEKTAKIMRGSERNILGHWAETNETPQQTAVRANQDASFRERMMTPDPTLAKDNITLKGAYEGAPEAELTVVRKPKPPEPPADTTEGKVLSYDPTGKVSPEDVVLSAFARRQSGRSFDDILHEAYREHFNEAHPFNRMVDDLSTGAKDPIKGEEVKQLMESTYYSAPRAEFVLKDGFPDQGVSALDKIVPTKADELKDFRALIGALHAEELHAKGIANPVDRAAANATIDALGKKGDLLKRAKEFTQFNNAMLGELVDAGIITGDTAAAWKNEFKFYAPFNRVLEEAPMSGVGSGNKRVFNPKKAQKGSERLIYDPLESTVRNAYSIYQVADRNRAANALYDLIKAQPEGTSGWAREKPIQRMAVEVGAPEAKKVLKAADIEEPDAAVARMLDKGTLKLWRTARQQAGKNDLVFYRPNAKTGKIDVKVLELDPQVAKFISGLDRTDIGLLGKILEFPNTLLKKGVTLSPDFPIVQVLRDNPWQFIFDKETPFPFIDLVNGMMHVFGDSPVYKEWQRKGGPLATVKSIRETYEHSPEEFIKRYDLRSGKWALTRNVVSSPLHALKLWADFWAVAPRVGVYARSLKEGKTQLEALTKSRRSQINFMKQGAVARQLNKIMPFYSPTMNALDQMVRAARQNPVTTLTRGAAMITVPVLTAWWAYHDEAWYKELPEWQKDQSVPFRVGNTTYLIPLPQGAGVIFGGIPRRVMDGLADHDKHAADGLIGSFMASLTPAIQISAVQPIVEQIANFSFFRNRPLVPDSLKGALPEDQYSAYTSETARLISKAVSDTPLLKGLTVSPIVLENYVRQWAGGLGTNALDVADSALRAAGVVPSPPRPADQLADVPFLHRFVARFPSANARSLTIYYENLKKHDQVVASLRLTKNRLVLDPRAPARLAEIYREHPRELTFLALAAKVISEQRRVVQLIEQNPAMSPEDKRRLIDQFYSMMILIARQANSTYDQLGDKFKEIEK